MTITLEELRKLLSMPGMTSYRQPVITPAFITESAFSVGDQAYSAVVTAGYIDKASGRFEITFDALGYTGPAPISLTIDDADVQAVREMLGIGSEVAPAPSNNDALTAKLLAKALKTLSIIADMEDTKQEPEDSWRETLFRTIELAQHTLDWIEIDAAQSEGAGDD